jgi:hypothetical protein
MKAICGDRSGKTGLAGYNLWYANIGPRLCRQATLQNENTTPCIANIFLETIRQIAVPREQW